MNVGKGCTISDKWIPQGVATDLRDVNGNELKTADMVELSGCTSRYAYIGLGMSGKFMLYFGGDSGSVGWFLTEETISKHKVKLKKR